MTEDNRRQLIRNHYYEGKPMRAEDFIKEQTYNNEKTRILSKPLHGKVLEGLNVHKESNTHIRIDKGQALDGEGNLLYLNRDITVELAALPEYGENFSKGNTYLYMQQKEEMLTEDGQEEEYVEVTSAFSVHSEIPLYYRGCKVTKIYEENGIRIYHGAPESSDGNRYVQGYFFMDKPRSTHVKAMITAGVEGALTKDYLNTFSVELVDLGEQIFLEAAYNLQITGEQIGNIGITFKELKLRIDEEVIELESFNWDIEKTKQRRAHEKQREVCLARLEVKEHEGQLICQTLEPFGKYDHDRRDLNSLRAKSNMLQLMPNEEPRIDVKYAPKEHELNFTFGIPSSPESMGHNALTTGTISIPIGTGREGRCFYSDLIDHQLGEGPVGVILAVEEKMKQLSGLPEPEEQLIFGDFTVFAESDCMSRIPPVDLAGILYPKEGKIKIGVKLKQSTKLKKLTIRWWAYKNINEVKEISEECQPIGIEIKPDRIELKKGQKIQLKAQVSNTENTDVTWRIMDSEGGKITQKGFYTAPMVRGVFKIEATSIADFSKTATVIVVIKD